MTSATADPGVVPPSEKALKKSPNSCLASRKNKLIVGAVVLITAAIALVLGLWGAGVFKSSSSSLAGSQATTGEAQTGGSGDVATQTSSTTAPTTTANAGPTNFLYSYTYADNVDTSKIAPDFDYVNKALFTPWSEWKAKCGNGKCEEGEWCRTCPQDCPCTTNCGNGLCEDGENGPTCPQDCTHDVAVCGNGKCENNQGNQKYWIYRYESSYNCPQDCPLNETCGNGKCEPTESCWTCEKDCGKCAPVCGDGACNGNENCQTCQRDCGYCDIKNGDGRCDWPRENPDNSPQDCTPAPMNNFTWEGVMYATIDNSDPKPGVGFGNTDCNLTPLPLPRGWKIAIYNNQTDAMLKSGKVGFKTGCGVFEGGFSRPMNAKETAAKDCEDNFIMVTNVNGVDQYSLSKDFCPSKIVIMSIASALKALPAEAKKKCPFDCSGHGACDVFSGLCTCNGRWTGPGCERVIGDLQIPKSTDTWYKPVKGIKWQWQLQQTVDMSFDVPLYDIDFDNSAATIAKLHKQGRKVMCYFSAGSWENFRQDQALFPHEFMGKYLNFGTGDDFKDEKWLDLRRMDVWSMLMLNRIDQAKRKGCDSIEFDNPDVIIHDHGISGPQTLNLQLVYNKWLVAQTHARGMAVALKNSNEFASYLYETYDMVVNEECWVNGNCDNYWAFIHANKPVLNCEYFTARCMYCDRSIKMGFSTIKKQPDLTPCRADCYTSWNNTPCIDAKFPLKYPAGNWCLTSKDDLPDECPNKRFAACDPNIGY